MRKISAALAFGAAVLATPAFAGVAFTSVAGTSANNTGVAGATANMTFNTPSIGTAGEATSKGLVANLSGSATRSDVVGSGQANGNGSGNFNVYTPAPYDGNGFFAIGGDGSLKLSSATGTNFSSISVFIGSIDAYNSIDLFDQTGAFIRSFSGTQLNNDVAPAYPGDGTQAGSRFVTFNATAGTLFSGIKFYNTGGNSAFEFDNVSFTAAVPEPATWAMMFLGFGMVAGAARYRRRSSKAVFA
ncbi:PEPxxWA-CTERM sorting domain-containing protein [Sphingomonas sp. KR1UV-12]|uniref:PEPxxWA-CTERM sorting domain-containing protein n=1 Tax=Sphingomonas aurea TaxID=3063994 RepID=A0ABT9ENS6_9SPHN|nr:PEPxxWA-CTERM sorting domain-containing protein [Sphingomonas sp. KR1UV-12]MDP1028608.1 PEPxxWA-CTERM sorting domain-containing protein [Sphingomonas sp. KR1UV-12]